jgi:hypothetical protein
MQDLRNKANCNGELTWANSETWRNPDVLHNVIKKIYRLAENLLIAGKWYFHAHASSSRMLSISMGLRLVVQGPHDLMSVAV